MRKYRVQIGITGTVDTTYVLDKKNRNDEETYLSVVGRDVEYNDYILKFDKDNCKWCMVSTAEKYQEKVEKTFYSDNTLVDTVKTLVSENNGSWSGTLKSINDKHKELYDYQYASNERKIREDLDKLTPMLMLVDKIKYIPCEKPQGGKRLQRFITIPC